MIELTEWGTRPLTLHSGETHCFLEDGDRVGLRGWCEGAVRIGFNEAWGEVLPATGC